MTAKRIKNVTERYLRVRAFEQKVKVHIQTRTPTGIAAYNAAMEFKTQTKVGCDNLRSFCAFESVVKITWKDLLSLLFAQWSSKMLLEALNHTFLREKF